ncbi:MAG: substrate-binding domain-containing protein [Xanthobacteraceae bacterium]|nr:substrate-binding domain-containing protein [Xanthobacteraceae bacterium]
MRSNSSSTFRSAGENPIYGDAIRCHHDSISIWRQIIPPAVDINVLSGAAVEPALLTAADVFRKRTGNTVNITFATTPEIRRRIGAGETPDVIIAPPAALDALAESGKIDGAAQVLLGKVGIGVVIRDGAPRPDVSTTDALKRALLDADGVVYNRASSGLYVDELLQRLGLAERIQAKVKRYIGTDMIEPLIHGTGQEIGFMPLVQILNWRGRGLQLVGPLPADIQSYTTYAAAPAARSDGGVAFVRFLEAPEAKALFAGEGIA